MNANSPPQRDPNSRALTYAFLSAVLPVASISCVISAIVIGFVYEAAAAVPLIVCLIVTTVLYLAIRWWWLPRITEHDDLDLISGVVFAGGLACVFLGVYMNPREPAVVCGLLILIGSLLFDRNLPYILISLSTLLGVLGLRLVSGYPMGPDYVHFLLLAPCFALLARVSWNAMRRRASDAQRALHGKVAELEQERQLRAESEQRLAQAQKMEGIGLLAAGAAHDFNNYLQVVTGMTELLRQDYPDCQTLDHLQAATTHAADMCQRMLTYAGKRQDASRIFDVVRCVRDLQPVLTAGLPRAAQVRWHYPDRPIWVDANQAALQQCLTNLLTNAADASGHAGGVIDVEITTAWEETRRDLTWSQFGERLPSSGVALMVTDGGIGMDPETLKCAFDPYFTTKSHGHGFGLAITLGIVRSLRGAIRCSSVPGKGTTMQLILPVAKEAPAPPAMNPVRPLDLVHRSILLVDDEPLVRASLSSLLEALGYHSVSAETAAEAASLMEISAEKFAAVLVDFQLRGSSGYQLLEQIRETRPDLPVVMLSGHSEESMRAAGDLVADAYLTKPYSLSSLQTTLERIC